MTKIVMTEKSSFRQNADHTHTHSQKKSILRRPIRAREECHFFGSRWTSIRSNVVAFLCEVFDPLSFLSRFYKLIVYILPCTTRFVCNRDMTVSAHIMCDTCGNRHQEVIYAHAQYMVHARTAFLFHQSHTRPLPTCPPPGASKQATKINIRSTH